MQGQICKTVMTSVQMFNKPRCYGAPALTAGAPVCRSCTNWLILLGMTGPLGAAALGAGAAELSGLPAEDTGHLAAEGIHLHKRRQCV